VRLGSAESAVDAALLDAVQADSDYTAGKACVLIFTRNTANADRVSPVVAAECMCVSVRVFARCSSRLQTSEATREAAEWGGVVDADVPHHTTSCCKQTHAHEPNFGPSQVWMVDALAG
jgi:hypothetical protein